MWDQSQGMKTQAPPTMKKAPPSPTPPQTPAAPQKGMKITLKEFAETTTAHGIGRIASSTQMWLRLFWALIFLTAFGVFIWQSVFLFIRFFDNPVTVDVKVVYEEVKFPAVSMCNLNALRKSQLPLGGPGLKKQIDDISDQLQQQLSGQNSTERRKRRKRRALQYEARKRGMTLDEIISVLENPHDRLRVRRETGVEPCASSPCKNGATCFDVTDTEFACTCDTGYSGDTCEVGGTSGGSDMYDPADDYFTQEVNLENKPWFQQDDQPDIRVQTAKNMSRILREVPIRVRQMMGHRIDTMVQECSWDGKQCTPLNFTGFLNRYYGNCYTFNSGYNMDVLSSTKPGSLYGLSLTHFIEQPEYIDALSPSAGVRILIHNQDQQPFPEDDGFDVTPGHKTSVTLRLRKQSKLPNPYSNCTHGEKEELMYKKSYSVGACRRSCLQILKYENCTCADSELPVPPDWKPVCSTNEEIKCSEKMDTAVESGSHPCDCPELCSENVFITSIATSEWPGEAFEQTIVKQFSARDEAMADLLKQDGKIRENFLKLEVFFEEIRYDEMGEQPAYGIENLLADIGGQLGLWIGVSVLTLVEFVQLVITLIQVVLSRKRVAASQQAQAEELARQQEQMKNNNYNDYPPPPQKQY